MKDLSFSTTLEVQIPKVKTKTNAKALKKVATKTFSAGVQKGATYVPEALRKALDASMDSSWQWIEGQRDIVDTGALKGSLNIATEARQSTIQFKGSYNQPYAAITHYGGMIRPYGNPYAAPVMLPARPWITAVFEGNNGQPKFSVSAPFQQGINEAWKSQFG